MTSCIPTGQSKDCETCAGKGYVNPGIAVFQCLTCGGKGFRFEDAHTYPDDDRTHYGCCPDCPGSGQSQPNTGQSKAKYRCDNCGYLHPQRCELEPQPNTDSLESRLRK